MNRYRPARQYLPASLVAAGLALFSSWCGLNWPLAFMPAGVFVLFSVTLYYLATRPAIEVGESYLSIGKETIRWSEVARIDSTVWTSPLVLQLGLRDGRSLRLIYPGDIESASRLIRQMRRLAREAVIDGVPYRQYWGEVVPFRVEAQALAVPRYRLMLPEDEAEVERLYQRLKSVGNLDPRSSADDRQNQE
ncbi:MAG: hypothetical protein WD733_09850 [Bryobacterales bacterium]|jgi:hypothetical protein